MFALLFWQIKSVCSKLRSCGVQGHLGVFGIHYETDNSRLYVVCAKHLTEAQLLNEFKVFGTVEVKLITDVNRFSKVDFFSCVIHLTNQKQNFSQTRLVIGLSHSCRWFACLYFSHWLHVICSFVLIGPVNHITLVCFFATLNGRAHSLPNFCTSFFRLNFFFH